MSSYKADVLTAMIATELDRRPRGTPVRLARHMGVTPQTITKWRKGEVHPDQERWPDLESFFEWDPGEVARRSLPVEGVQSTLDLVRDLTAKVRDLAERVTALEGRRRPRGR